jgi:hypothetical protein
LQEHQKMRIVCPLTFVGAILMAALPARGASLEWVRQFGSSAADRAASVATDPSGNVYVSGSTYGSLGSTNVGGTSDAFVTKYDAAGQLVWTRQLGTTDSDESRATSVDGLDNVFVAGVIAGSDALLANYDAEGNLKWTRQFGTNRLDSVRAASSDGLGNVYVTGPTFGSLDGINPNEGGTADVFVRKYDSTGTLQWGCQFGTVENDSGWGISADGLGNVYLTGFTDGSLAATNAGAQDAFIRKYDVAGNVQWTRQFGSSSLDWSRAAAADGLGNVYLAGFTWGGLGAENAGERDAFVTKYDATGAWQWTRQLGTNSGEAAEAVSADGLGVYIAGLTVGNLDGTNAGGNDAFITKYDAAGNRQWIQQIGTTSSDEGTGLFADGKGHYYLSGDSRGNLGAANVGETDGLVIKFTEPGPGDFDGSGAIDGDDFLLWQGTLGSTTDLAADGDASGKIDAGDLAVWKEHFPTGQTIALAAVEAPEPAAIILASALLVTTFAFRSPRIRHNAQRTRLDRA